MLDSIFAINELGSGRIRLPLDLIEANNISYAQPIIVTSEINGELLVVMAVKTVHQQRGEHCAYAAGVRVRYLCAASVAKGGSGSFDPSLQCGLHSGPLCLSQGSQLPIIVRPITSKAVAATSIKVGTQSELHRNRQPRCCSAACQQQLIASPARYRAHPSRYHLLAVAISEDPMS